MLRELHIENVAVIEKADIEFAPGLNVMTGETGAGKSIVIDALGAVLGGRTSKDLVRTGAASALVSAVFSADGTGDWCEENGIEPEEGQLFLMRRISDDGKNTCRINGVPVSAGQLRSLGVQLLDIHGQNDGQKLLDERYHRDYLDSFGCIENELSAYKDAYASYLETKKEIDSLRMDEREKQFRIDTLRFQIDELTKAEIKPGERDEKTSRRALLQNAGKISGAVDDAYSAIYGGDRTEGVVSLIEEARQAISQATRYSDRFTQLEQSLTDLKYDAEDISEQLMDLRMEMDFSPEELDEIESRLSILRKLSIKYGSTEEEMLEYLEKSKTELDNIEYASEKIEKLEVLLQKRFAAAKSAADDLSTKRRNAAKMLEQRIKSELSGLSMPNVRFEVVIEDTGELSYSGCDEVRFEMSANAGEKVGRISRIASGGELARIMLAMKNVLAENDDIETMVFDEVDTGVSGIAAQRVGEKLAKLACKKQVICVTHLPQIAAMADEHYEISKTEEAGRTYTDITRLDMESRRRELARLSGGENITEITLCSAKEQIDAANAYKRSIR